MKRKSNVALLIGTIVILLLIPIWYTTLIPYIIGSQLEKIDSTTTLEGIGSGLAFRVKEYEVPILINAHAYTVGVRGDNVTMRVDMIMTRTDTIRLENRTGIDLTNPVYTEWEAVSKADEHKKYKLTGWKDNNMDGKLSSSDRIDMWVETHDLGERSYDVEEVEYGTDTYMNVANETLPDFSGNLTYVFNKFNRKHVPDAPEEYPDVNRTGYGATLYPSHLKAGENISNVWLDSLNTTGTLEYIGKEEKDGVTLYKYFLNKTITKEMVLPGVYFETYTLTSTKTILIEPLMGVPAYIENETFTLHGIWRDSETLLVYLTYKFSNESIAQGIKNAKMAYNGMQLLELYIPTIFGVIAIILTVVLAFNVRRLRRKSHLNQKQ